MKYEYFCNVLAQVKFEIEAKDEEAADALAINRADNFGWEDFRETGLEIGRMTEGGGWDHVYSAGDLS